MGGSALILGANGRFGGAVAGSLAGAGWRVRAFARGRDDLMQAARGADVIVNGWNPAYPRWQRELPLQTARLIAAARASGATVIVPGNVYVYGPDMPARLTPGTPQRARNPLGRARREMETAWRDSGVATILLRAGDFIDTAPSGTWFDRVLTARLDRGSFTWMGRWDLPHAWAFLPDLARAALALAERRRELARFEEIPFPGYSLGGEEMARVLERACGRALRRRNHDWTLFRALAPISPLLRHVLEMRYLWDRPHVLDETRFREVLPDFRPTPPVDALRQAVGFRC